MGKRKRFKRLVRAKVLTPFPDVAPKSMKRSASPEPEAESKVEANMTRRAETTTGTVGNIKMDPADETIEEKPPMRRVQSPPFFDGLHFTVQLAVIVGDERAIKAARKICKGGRTDGTMSEKRLMKLIEILDYNPAAVSLLAESMQEKIQPFEGEAFQSPGFNRKERSTGMWKTIIQPRERQPPSVSSVGVARRNDLAATNAKMDATTDDEDQEQEQDKSSRPSPQVLIKEEPGVEQTRNGDGGNDRSNEVINLDTDSDTDTDTDKNGDKEKQNNSDDKNQAEAMGPSSDDESKSELPLGDKTNKEIDNGQETASESTTPTDTLSGDTLPVETALRKLPPVETTSRKAAPAKKRPLKAVLRDSAKGSTRDAHKQTKSRRKQTQSRQKQTQRRKKSEASVLRMVGGKMQRGTSSYLDDDSATNDGDDLSNEDVRDESLSVETGVDASSSDEGLNQGTDFRPSDSDDDHCDNEENDDNGSDDGSDDGSKSSQATSASDQSREHMTRTMHLCYTDYPKTMIRGSNANYCFLECSNDLFQRETRVVFTKQRSRNLMEAIKAKDADYAIGVVMTVSTQSGLTTRTIAIKRHGQLKALGKTTRDAIEKSVPMRRRKEPLPKHVRDGLWSTSTPP